MVVLPPPLLALKDWSVCTCVVAPAPQMSLSGA